MALPAMAASDFWEDRQRGYYWYEDPVQKEVTVPDGESPAVIVPPWKAGLPDTYSYDELFNLHPDQFQVMIDARLKTAVHHPTEQNVLKFLEAVDVAKNKSRTLANVAGYVAMQNPRLNGEYRYPHSQPGRGAYLKQRSAEIKATLERYRDRYAIIAFNREGCTYCTSQEDILARFEFLNRWPVRRIDINENPALAARFQVDMTPTLLLVSRDTQKSQIISAGVIALDQLNKRIYRLVRLMEGTTVPERFYNMDFNAALTPKRN
jgi:conjugal transfer pilus assembly protein TraF